MDPRLWCSSLVLLLLGSAVPGAAKAAPASPSPQNSAASWEPHADPALPNVLLLGDSISIGYTRAVRRLLQGEANVYRPLLANGRGPENCRDTRYGLKQLDPWIGERKWAVIHFNWGLWDLCYRSSVSRGRDNRDKVNGTLAVPLEEYERNLEQLVTRLERTGAMLIWASTTAVPRDEPGRFIEDNARYNRAAAAVMARHHVRTDDLYTATQSIAQRHSAGPGNVHYTEAGYDEIARIVAASIRDALRPNSPLK